MTQALKPLLAATLDGVDLKELPYPLIASPKLDGVRILIHDGADDRKGNRIAGVQPATRKIVQLPNLKIRAFLSRPELEGLDGELVSGPITHPDVFNSTTRIVMKGEGPGIDEPVWLYNDEKGKPKMSFAPVEGAMKVEETVYWVFDDFSMKGLPFSMRYANAKERIEQLPDDLKPFVKLVPHVSVQNDIELGNIENLMVNKGYEGVMVRKPGGAYKYGRSTVNEMILAKVKRFEDTDGIIVSAEEMMHNDNEKVRDALGNAKRSSHAENLRPAGMLGAFVVKLPEMGGVEVKVGSGYTEDMKLDFWNRRDELIGKTIVVKYQPSGMKDLPRFPTFKGFRQD